MNRALWQQVTKLFLLVLSVGAVFFKTGAVQAAPPSVFTDEVSFISALTGPQSLVDFNSAPTGLISGSEFAAQGLVFHSPLASPLGQLEIAPPDFFASSNYLNIDRRPFAPGEDNNEDGLEVMIVGNWRAVGFRIVDSSIPQAGESITVFDQFGNIIYTQTPADGAVSYFGIIADVPIGRIFIDEAALDVDDVGYDDFRLGNPIATVSPVCDIQLNKTTFVNGDQVIAQVARLANPGPTPVPVEVKLWFELSGNPPPVPFLTVGADGRFVLTPGFNQDFGPLRLATVQESVPRGPYSFNCRLLHAVTGAPLGEDFNPFQLQ